MPRNFRLLLPAMVLASGLSVLGCATHYIPNTDVEDTPDNREAVLFCEKYRKALERRDVPLLLSMLSPRYYEDGGNADASDDLDYQGVRDYLTRTFRNAKAIRYEIRYRNVRVSKEAMRTFIDYTYSASYKVPGIEEQDEWRHTVSENRIELVKDGESFKIVAGM